MSSGAYLQQFVLEENQSLLRWEPVQDDGGTDVKHYIVEYFRYCLNAGSDDV